MKKKLIAMLLCIALSVQSFPFTAHTYADAPLEAKRVTVSTDYNDYTEITMTEGETVQLVLPENTDMPEIERIYSIEQKTAVTHDLKLTALSAGDEEVSVYISYKGMPYQDTVHIRAHILRNESISDETRTELDRLEKLDGYYRRRMELLGVIDENAPRLDMEKVQEIIDTSEDYFDIFARLNRYHVIADRIPGGVSMTSYTYWFDEKGSESVTWYLEQDMITYTKTDASGIVEESQFLYPERSELYKDGKNINYDYIQFNRVTPQGFGTLELNMIDEETNEPFTDTHGTFRLIELDGTSGGRLVKSWNSSEGSEVTIGGLSRESVYELSYIDSFHDDCKYELDFLKSSYTFSFGQDSKCSSKVYLKKRSRSDPFIVGDVNSDMMFNAADIIAFRNWLLGRPNAVIMDERAADVCRDGELNILDLCMLKRKLCQSGS